jgi:hypothetical protein
MAGKAKTKAKVTLKQAKAVGSPLQKKETGTGPAKKKSVVPEKTTARLSKSELRKRQQAKGKTRKQGGTRFDEVPDQDIRAHVATFEAGPSQVNET